MDNGQYLYYMALAKCANKGGQLALIEDTATATSLLSKIDTPNPQGYWSGKAVLNNIILCLSGSILICVQI